MYDSHGRGDGCVQLETGFERNWWDKEEDPVPSETCIFQVHFLGFNRVSLEGIATRCFINVSKALDNIVFGDERPHNHYDEESHYDDDAEQVPWAKLSFFCSDRPFDDSLYPKGVLLHDLDCISIVQDGLLEPNNSALSMTQKKKKFRSSPRTPFSRGLFFGELSGKTSAEVQAITDEAWNTFEGDYKYIEEELKRLTKNKRFYGEKEYLDLYELLLYGLFSTIASGGDLINSKELALDQNRRNRLWKYIMELFVERILQFYEEICGEVIVLFLRLSIETEMDCIQQKMSNKNKQNGRRNTCNMNVATVAVAAVAFVVAILLRYNMI